MVKRPSVVDLDSFMVAKPAETPRAAPAASDAPADQGGDKGAKAFRTSVYFHRSVHDVLRDIAHAERKNVSDLINEGLDHVLTSRNYPTTEELRTNSKAS